MDSGCLGLIRRDDHKINGRQVQQWGDKQEIGAESVPAGHFQAALEVKWSGVTGDGSKPTSHPR